MKTFTAQASAATELPEIGAFVVVLAEHMDGSGARLEIQLATSFDEQDQALGQDTYCLCTEDGATHYGGVASWTMARDLLQIRLDAEAERTLGVEGGFSINVPSDDLPALEKGLTRALGIPARATNSQR